MAGTLFVVGTPIGNLGDFSPRAVETLNEVDFIAAEDTRVTVKLLNRFNIKKTMISYFEHNLHKRGEEIIERLKNGESCALVSDAGMPAISDPGQDLVRQCIELGIKTVSVPGPSAVISALSISGMETGRFTFEGFLSMNKNKRKQHLEDIRDEKRTMVFYEAPHKLPATLRDLLNTLGDREICIVRELTKIHEEVIPTTLSMAKKRYKEKEPKGEFVLIIKGKEPVSEAAFTLEQAVSLALEIEKSGQSLSSAAKEAALETGIKKSEIYKAILEKRD